MVARAVMTTWPLGAPLDGVQVAPVLDWLLKLPLPGGLAVQVTLSGAMLQVTLRFAGSSPPPLKWVYFEVVRLVTAKAIAALGWALTVVLVPLSARVAASCRRRSGPPPRA